MNDPHDTDRSPTELIEPARGVVLVCEDCHHTWEPHPAELGAGPVTCPHCEGWTVIAELATPTPRGPAGEPTADGPRSQPSPGLAQHGALHRLIAENLATDGSDPADHGW